LVLGAACLGLATCNRRTFLPEWKRRHYGCDLTHLGGRVPELVGEIAMVSRKERHLCFIKVRQSLRVFRDWYRSAQELRRQDSVAFKADDIIGEENNEGEKSQGGRSKKQQQTSLARAATRELHIHELTALISCFVFPLVGTWLLHTIRGSLSRPSEGLVSNYNLTIFLLAAEIRPFAHLLRMVQARTLYLQRIVAASPSDDDRIDKNKFLDLARRLEELEAHVADTAAANLCPDQTHLVQKGQEVTQDAVAQVTSNVRKGFQPELDALNRAVRRYEKRTTLMAFQTDSRLQELETQVRDAIALAAAAQRSASDRRRSFAFILLDWTSAILVLPAQTLFSLASLPAWVAAWCLQNLKLLLGVKQRRPSKLSSSNKGKQPQNRSSTQLRMTAPTTWREKGTKKAT
jgi:hypothetical protein